MPAAVVDTSPQTRQMNGHSNHHDSEEEEKAKIRPVEIKEDMSQMSSRRRVSLMLKSEQFKSELEECVRDHLTSNNNNLQQLRDFLTSKSASALLIPINDVRGIDGSHLSAAERNLRCKLAALHRVVDQYGWSQSIYNHITARLPTDSGHYLVKPHGLLNHEITAAALVTVDLRGNIVDDGITTLGINAAGYALHSSIHKVRPDLKCVIHLHTPAVVAVAAMKCGLLPCSQEACVLGEIAYCEYEGIETEATDVAGRALGPVNKVLMLNNHGAMVGGETVEEAFWMCFNLFLACEAQTKMAPAGVEHLHVIAEEVQKKVMEIGQSSAGGVSKGDKSGVDWMPGELEFTAEMRKLDGIGLRTGYLYKQAIMSDIDRKHDPNVVIPPIAAEPFSPARHSVTKQKGDMWLNSPNAYQKVEIQETGARNPKTVTKWVAESGGVDSPSKGTPIKIESANQFAPIVDKKELRSVHERVKKGYYMDSIGSGPKSRVLDEGTIENVAENRDQMNVVVGAASKGVIQRDFQHNARVYNQVYNASNPFERITDDELARYEKTVLDKHAANEVVVTQVTNAGDSLKVTQTTLSSTGDTTDEAQCGIRANPQQVDEASPVKKDKKKKKFRIPSFTKKDKKKPKNQAREITV